MSETVTSRKNFHWRAVAFRVAQLDDGRHVTLGKEEQQMAFVKSSTIAFLVSLTLALPNANAQHSHVGEHGKPVEFKMPTTYKAAVAEIRFRLHEIEELMQAKKLDQVHAQAEIIQKVGDVIGQLALKADSNVPRTAVKDVNRAGRQLAAKFDAIDKAGDSGDLPGTQKVYAEMRALFEILDKHVPKEYACPMRCEGVKVHLQPGKCSKCGMKLQDVNSHQDHNAKHGGIFFMAPDHTHHLEGTISRKGEFRVWFYDEYTRAIPADRFTAEGTAWSKDADARKPFKMATGPEKAYLTVQTDASIRFPACIRIHVDFKDGQKPQVFDFEFAEPSDPGLIQEATEKRSEPGK